MVYRINETSSDHSLKNQKFFHDNELSCVACSQGKLISSPSLNKVGYESLSFLQRIQDDIYGLIHPTPCGPFRYFMVLIDAWSHVCLLSSLNLVFARLLA